MTKLKNSHHSDDLFIFHGISAGLESAPLPAPMSDPTSKNCGGTPPVLAVVTTEPACPVSVESSAHIVAPEATAVVRNNAKKRVRPKTRSAKQSAKKRARDREYKRRQRAKKISNGLERLELDVPGDLGARMRAEAEKLKLESVAPLVMRALLREFPSPESSPGVVVD